MALPTEPDIYTDVRGDLWILHDDQRWQWVERRLTDGRGWPVHDYKPVRADTLESLAGEPGVELLPFTRVQPPLGE